MIVIIVVVFMINMSNNKIIISILMINMRVHNIRIHHVFSMIPIPRIVIRVSATVITTTTVINTIKRILLINHIHFTSGTDTRSILLI